jgi:dCMP deaminase
VVIGIIKEPVLSKWDVYYLGIADAVAKGSKCVRSQVGYVIVTADMQEIISTGYNGTARGQSECFDTCPRAQLSVEELPPNAPYDVGPGRCIAVHAEMNALLRAGMRARGAVMYGTRPPCFNCRKHIDVMEVRRIVAPSYEAILKV